jgi:hypothetical protein
MKRIVTTLSLALAALSLASCASDPPPTHVHHYHTTRTRYVQDSYYKPAGVSGGGSSTNVYNAPENFSAVSPPHSYSN